MAFLVVNSVSCLLIIVAHFWYFEVIAAFSIDRTDNLAVYWGQDSAGKQQRLSFYCEDDTIDTIPISFVYDFFGKGGQPVLELANICSQSADKSFSGTDLVDCSFLEPDIQNCQSKGKIVTLSLGGGDAKVGLTSDAQANTFANTIWNMFLGGTSDMRPFGDAVLDGVDLDIEAGSSAHYATFVNKIRSLAKNAKKRYYITAAPQCPFPDANIGGALNSASFDAVYVQFYNNYCEVSSPSEFNFDTWEKWAENTSPNKDIKVYLGAPASPKAAGDGYVPVDTLSDVVKKAQKEYPHFGGVMLWDADEAYNNDRYDLAIKKALTGGGRKPTTTVVSTTHKPTTVQPPSPTKTTPHEPSTTSAEPDTTSFRDPRATARVKRPSLLQANEASNQPKKRQASSRFFRF